MYSIIYLICFLIIREVQSHGRLLDPPARGTAWRKGFDTPKDYTDQEKYCGGISNLKAQGGKCGVCGDPYQGPKENECPNGKYCKKVIVKTYKSGETIKIDVQLTANHKGYFTFKVCRVTKKNVEVTQQCLDKNPLKLVGKTSVKYKVPGGKTGIHSIQAKLPNGLKCKRCVLQWHYRAANNWNACKDGKHRPGCGLQEVFRGCADISIK